MRRLSIVLLGLAAFATSCSGPSFVEKVTIANPHEYSVLAEVGDGARWLSMGRVNRESEETTQDVIDMGERWIFRFRYPYEDEVEPIELSLTRSELAGGGWRVEVPESLALTLRKRGEPPSFKG